MGSLDVQVFLKHVNNSAAYLWDPPYGSWVQSVSHMFFVMGIATASPVILLIALDFTSYAIVRTLGIENAHPVSSRRLETPSPTSETEATTTSLKGPAPAHRRPSQISIPPPSLSVTPPHEFFTTPGGLQAAGLNLFSPPHSPPPSPSLTRKAFGSNLRRENNSIQHSISDRDQEQFEGSPHSEDQEPFITITNDDEGETPSVVLVRKRRPAVPTNDT